MLRKISEKYIDFNIRKRAKNNLRKKHFANLQSISSVLLLFSADRITEKKLEIIKNLLGKKMRVTSWVFVPYETFLKNKMDVNLFNKKDISILQKPIEKVEKSFLANEYDILIDLTTTEILPLKYLLGISHVACRCGLKKEGYSFYDLEIEASAKIKETELLKQILHYLDAIQTKS